MDDRGGEKTPEIMPGGGGNEVREEKGVKMDSTPTVNKPVVIIRANAAPNGHPIDCKNRLANIATKKDCLRSLHNHAAKMGSGSSGDPDPVLAEDIGDPAAKKRKTRRGKPKHRKQKPYSKQQMCFEQRLRSRGRLAKTRGQPPAPYNTTQFLMEDHSDLPELEQKLADVITSDVVSSFQKPLAPPRTRDSSFSVDSDEDYFYSSPEDEEEFLTKEFSSAYEASHAERLGTMTKTELIQEFVQLETKFDIVSKRLRGKSLQSEECEADAKNNCGTVASAHDSELGKKLKICQQRIDDLIQQNDQLRRDNEKLRIKNNGSCSVDSESDSDTSSCSCSGKSGNSPQSSKKLRLEKENRRNKRQSSIDSESDSDTTISSKASSGAEKTNQNLVNCLTGNLEIPSSNTEAPSLQTTANF